MKNKGKLDSPNPLHALLPGAKIDLEKGTISVNVGISTETIIFNVGGVKFETFRSTLNKQPNSPLAKNDFIEKHFRPEHKDYFFDRDPDTFKAILNYLRTGELHIPNFLCGPAVKTELEFWGVPENLIARCCTSHYNSYNATLEALNQLEHDRKGSFLLSQAEVQTESSTKLGRFRMNLSLILNQPETSTLAKIYGVISLFVVAVSILGFLAETHPTFLIEKTVDEVKTVFNETLNRTTTVISQKSEVKPHPLLDQIDLACMIYFTVEYLARVITTRRRLHYIRSLMGIIDLIALVPDYIQLILLAVDAEHIGGDTTKIITILKVTRILRIFRLVRHVPGLWILIYTLKASLKELLLMTAFLLVGMLIFSSLIYYADDRKVFTSIPHSFWWALITMTTVGYGDMYPVTNWGYVIGSLTALSGLLMIGFSVPILVNNFLMYYKHVEFALREEEAKRIKQTDRKHNTRVNHTNEASEVHVNENNNESTSPVYTIEVNEKL